ncbi:Gfo/Idh/MocA family oxidoreductase [Radiobacillus kanasensis]|uniref:Gfo/Idh/MocA family protein n=1 Tax=Radiobacillus kanasensis TaxID=2844358 RepID=UPI001E3DE604|nr:Gfo/Idh/MocA family oxidoreductase [Radiobacillus kanasensis]UFT98937.1 Gfo/Idh/MocA family oxidoreductase [Radiobacillus kanasensis]
MGTLKVGVVGCGSIANHRHLPEYQNNPDAEIIAVCDKVEDRAKATAERFGAGKYYTDYHELLQNEEIDIVSVCTPNYLHAPVSIAALQAGKHVLCEKPMATSEKEANEMIAAAEKSGKKLMIGHNQRFVPSHQKAKELIASGELGRIYSFRTTFGHGGPEGWSADGKNSWFFKKEEAFIGALGDLGVHKADLIRYILGEEVKEVAALVEGNAKENSTVDDNAVALLRTESGIIGTLTASWAYVSSEDNSTIIYGEKGIIRLEEDPVFSMVIQYKDGSTVNYQLGQIQTNESQSNSGVIDHFVESVKEDKTPLITGDEGWKSLQVIIAALEANETKKNVQL